MNIKNIIFDLGGVIIDISFERMIHFFQDEHNVNIKPFFTGIKMDSIFIDFELGLITIEEFRFKVKKILNINITDNEFDNIWNKILLGYDIKKLNLLEKLKKHYNTFILSNTNILHRIEYNNMLNKLTGKESLSYYVKKAYYSDEIHLRKPDVETFKLVLDENNIKPEETLFVDDTEINILAAKQINMQTHHVNKKNTVFNLPIN